MEITQIKNQIITGLNKGYWQNLQLISSYSSFVDQIREYLLTVNIAQQLLDWNSMHNYNINLEYSVYDFYNNAFSDFRIETNDIFDMSITRRKSGHSPTEKMNQKIDIVISQNEQGDLAHTQNRTLCGIELKAINVNDNDILNDAKRLSNAMIKTDVVSKNSIEFCFCGFLRRIDKDNEVITEDMVRDKKTSELCNWEINCRLLCQQYPNLLFEIEDWDITKTTFENVAQMHEELDSDFSEVANDTGLVVGYILSIQRKGS